MSELTTARYDLPLDSPGPRTGDLFVRTTGTWYVIVDVRPVAQRRPHPYQRWALSILRQAGPVPSTPGWEVDGVIAWEAASYPKGVDVDEYWTARGQGAS